jgi:hypothetical protein
MGVSSVLETVFTSVKPLPSLVKHKNLSSSCAMSKIPKIKN